LSKGVHLAELAEQELQHVSHITGQTLSFIADRNSRSLSASMKYGAMCLTFKLERPKANRIELRRGYQCSVSAKGFPVELRQVFLNLIGNAIQAIPDGGVLQIYVREEIDRLTQRRGAAISAIDTGVGISPEDSRRPFEPFFKTKATKGTGLGLWISKGILQKHDGRILYRSYRRESRSVTCFGVFLPSSEIYNFRKSDRDDARTPGRAAGSNDHGIALQSGRSERGISTFTPSQIAVSLG
jgi:signal transduction histidine kinase